MKRYLPLILVLALLLLGGIYLARNGESKRRFDRRISLRQEDRIPYGTYLARKGLVDLFPRAHVFNERDAPGRWDSVQSWSKGQALIYIGYYIDADPDEVSSLLSFAGKGNYVFLVGADFSPALCDALRFETSNVKADPEDSTSFTLESPRLPPGSYWLPGTDIGSLLVRKAPDSTLLLGTRGGHAPNFLQYRVGAGAVFVHSSPLAFSNYFLLQPGNERYFAGALSVLPPDLDRIGWSEYYLSKTSDKSEPSFLSVLMRYRAFSWALWLFLALVVLYGISEMRRRQRWIPPYERPRNESLDFVTTVGRLYYDQRDHHDLAGKMIQYFLDHVRQQYKIPTGILDEEFLRRLHARSGYPRPQLDELLQTIHAVRASGFSTETELARLHQQLENYYQYG